MKERKKKPEFLRKVLTVFLTILVSAGNMGMSISAEDANGGEDIQETYESSEMMEESIYENGESPEGTESDSEDEYPEYQEDPERTEMPADTDPADAVTQSQSEADNELEDNPDDEVSEELIADEGTEEIQEVPDELNEPEEVIEDVSEADNLLFVYEAKDAADMAAAVAALDDDDSRRLVANTDDDLSEILDVEGTAVYYDGSYIISLDDPGNVDDAMITISSLTDASPVRDERMELCADGSFIEARENTETKNVQFLQNINGTGPYVALIDTGVSGYAVDSINLTSDPDGDSNGHGTMMAETILNASDGNAMILSIKAFNDDGTASLSNIYAAVRYAIESDVDIINISAAMPDSENTRAVKEILTEATNKGITVVVAAGNRGTDASSYFPANMGNVVTVGAATNKGQVVINSNFGSCVDYYVTALSTSFAAARMTGYLVTGNIDRADVFQWIMPETDIRPEDYMDINSEEYKRMKIAGCWDAEGCYLTSERDWWLDDLGVYLTKVQAVDGTFMCYERGHAFVASVYHYAGPAASDDGILAAWGYATGYGPGTNFERAQRAIWGQDREAALADAYAWAASISGGTAVHAQPSFDASSKNYIPGQEVVFYGNSDVSEYGYYVTDVSVSGGDDIKTSDVSARISGNNLYVTVSDQANEVPETVTITVDTDLPDEPGSFTCDSAYFTSEVDSQGMLYAGRVDGTPGKTYDSVKVTLKLGVHGGYELFKIDADRNNSPGQGDATLAGAEFTLYNRRNGRKVKTIIAEDGSAG